MKKNLLINLDFSVKSFEKSENGDSIYIRGYANTTSVDRGRDIIPSSTWEKRRALENYRKNPILLAYHDHSKPVGVVEELNITPLGLEVLARVSKGAGDIYTLVRDEILRTFSIGFMALEVDYNEEARAFIIEELELLEISIVSVPMNQDSTFTLEKALDTKSYQDLRSSLTAAPKKKEYNSELEKLLDMLNGTYTE